ncbi:MAG: alpha/beta fold hydrolase, partial [Myxococcota bacterium]
MTYATTTTPRAWVLLHGFTGSPASWDAVVAALPSDVHVLRPALLGHGNAAGVRVPSFEAEVDRIADLIEREGLDRPGLCGYSLGGRVALGLLVRRPDRFARAVLVGAHPGLADVAERQARAVQDAQWAALLETGGLAAFVQAWERLPLFATQEALPQALRERQRAVRLAHDPAGLARSLRVLGLGRMPDHRPALGAIRVPARLMA